jgi:hypothetical protein
MIVFWNRRKKLLREGYRESRNPDVLYKKIEADGRAAIRFVNLSTGEEWEKEIGNHSARGVEISPEVGEAARLYLECLAAVEEDFPELRREDMHKVASVLFKGLYARRDGG